MVLRNFYCSLLYFKGESIKECSSDVYYVDGIAVVARFSADNRWYRAIIISSVQCDPEDKDISTRRKQYNVLYVDFGNSEAVHAQNILPLLEEFSDLPMETIPCKLADIEPPSREFIFSLSFLYTNQ